MFIDKVRHGYTRDGSQWAHGRFLMLMTDKDVTPERDLRGHPIYKVRGLVRYVRMHQLGHFMMARLRIKAGGEWHKLSLSGTYGSDGLLLDVPAAVYALGKDLPADLYDKWAHGGGHNSAGSEAPGMHAWALREFPPQRRR